MVVALIVVGVIVFLAVDAYIMWRIFLGGSRAARYGSVAAPGEATLNLPAGTVKLTYQEAVHSFGGGEHGPIDFYVPDVLRLTLVPAAGGSPLELRPDRGHHAQTIASFLPSGPRSRVRIGTVEVPAAGEYVLRAEGDLAGATEPTVLAG
jgi:hypothetical protein